MAETVLIDFQIDDSQLVSALERLEKAGSVDLKMATAFKQTSSEIAKQSTEIKKVASSTVPLKKNLEDVNKATKQFTRDFMTGFNEGVIETLKEAGVSVEQFTTALEGGQAEAGKSTESLRQRLKVLTQQIAEMKLAGEDGTEQFKKLVIEAGNIKDAMQDAGAEIKNAGSDTRSLDNLLGAAQAVAGGFAVVQGTAALFGDESEELQQTLLKVNAVMAVMQGLQQISNALEKEGAITRLGNTIATKGQIAAQVVYNAVVGTSIGLMKALRIAFALTGIGALILGITALVQWLTSASKATKQLTKDFTKFNLEIERDLENFKKNLNEVKRANEEHQADLKARGALQSKITKEGIKGMKDELVGLFEIQKGMRARRDEAESVLRQMATGERKYNEALADESQKTIDIFNDLGQQRLDIASNIRIQEIELEKQTNVERLQAISDSLQGRLALTTKNSKQELELTKQLARSQAAIALLEAGQNSERKLLIERELKKQLIELDFEFERLQLTNAKAAIDAKLESVKEGTKDELNFKIEQAKIEAAIELKEQGISAEKRLLIETQLLKKIQELRVNFFNKLSKDVLTIESAGNAALIASVETSNEERLDLQLANIEIERTIQLAAAKGNAAEILRINAEADQKALEVRKNAIDQAAQYEIDLRTAKNGPSNRALEKIISDEKKGLSVRKAAIKQLADFQISNIDIQLKALEEEKNKKLISEEDYILKYEQLQDKKRQISEEAEKQITKTTNEENIKRTQIATQVLNQIIDIIDGINETQAQKENNRLSAEREKVAELLETGAITEREAIARNKRLDLEEKKIKQQQAQREKNVAVFRALLAIPQAVLQGLAQGGPILAAIYGALAAAQAVIIASRPLPRFGHGKKSGYQGLAEIGETGPELYEQNGKMYLADKKQLVWLAASDKVFNPTETKEMLMPVVDKHIMNWQAPTPKQPDAKQIAAELAKTLKKMPGTNINIDEYGLKVWVQQGMSRKNYMDKRYSSK